MGAPALSGHTSGHVGLAPGNHSLDAPQLATIGVTFRFLDSDHTLQSVMLRQDLKRPRRGPEFTFDEQTGVWSLYFPRPRVNRMEYRFELVHRDGGSEEITDPGNPQVAPGPFGDKSVIEWPEYSQPGWCSIQPSEMGIAEELEVESKILRARVPAVVWTGPGAEPADELPLLVAHDGPELAQFSDLLHLLAVKVTSRELPPMRVALLAPIDRDQHYSASAVYARALALELVPALTRAIAVRPGRTNRVAMGASLGALAMLHAHRTYPALFGGLFLQSGSFFRQRFDPQEARFVRFRRITRFVGQVLGAREWPHPVQIAMTCGTVEENLANNKATFGALRAQGYDGGLYEVPDAHNWIAWRDAFDPALVELLARTWT